MTSSECQIIIHGEPLCSKTKINRQRWEIEENFRIMKSEFEVRPVYARREDRIKAHFFNLPYQSAGISVIGETKTDKNKK